MIENFDKFKEHVARATEILNKLPIVIDDSSSLSADQVCGIIKKTHLKYGVACAFVDHTGMIHNDGLDDWKSYEYTYSQYMQTAKNTGVPIISLMQYLKSQKENKPDGYRPTIFDIRGGKAAQDASMKILHMWKPDIHSDYINKHPELKGKIFVLNDKNRDGSLMKDIELQFYGGTLKEAKEIINMNQEIVNGLENFASA
jgi:replicative DNA helicase